MDICIMDYVHFTGVVSSLCEDIVGALECLIQKDELPAQIIMPCRKSLAEHVHLLQDLIKAILGNSFPLVDTKVTKGSQKAYILG